MFSLTRQEKWVLVFLSFLTLIGLGAGYLKKIPSRIEGSSVFQHSEKDHTLRLPQSSININKAGFKELIEIKGVGPKTAERIIEYRLSYGPFSSIEDIQKVKGIGPKKFKAISRWITTE